MNAPVQLAALRATQQQQVEPDFAVDLSTSRGIRATLRLLEYYMDADALPAAFRRQVLKRSPSGDQWVENPGAMGNCLIAYETAKAVGMSFSAVAMNAHIIEGKLSWSAQFVIAAVNASRRFTPLRFDVRSGGRIKATYKEKQQWNKEKRGFDFKDVTVEVENLICVAWAFPHGFPIPANVYTLDQARAAKLPVIESSPVSMKLAVEEGWYGKPGSKWQTEMRHQMLQYRSGAFFGRIHAPDIVMGMGRTTEEIVDIETVDVSPAGQVTGVTMETLSRPRPPAAAEVVQQQSGAESANDSGADPQNETPAPDGDGRPDAPNIDALAAKLEACTSEDALNVVADELRGVADADAAAVLSSIYDRRLRELQAAPPRAAGAAPAPTAQQAQARRTRPINSPE